MSTFDFEPEDAYDRTDAPLARARNIARRLRLVDGRPDPPDDDPGPMLAELEARIVAAADSPVIDQRARLRLEQAALDLLVLRADV